MSSERVNNMRLVLTGILMLLITMTAQAVVSDLEDTITIGETPYKLEFNITNDSEYTKEVEINYNFPTTSEEISTPNKIAPHTTEKATILIYPKEGFEGNVYESTITIKTGGDRAEKKVRVVYEEENYCTINMIAKQEGAKLTLLLENESYKEKKAKLKGFEGLPSDWSVIGDNSFNLQGYEKKEYNYGLDRQSPFSGKVKAEIECENGTKEAEFTISYGTATGFVSLSSLTSGPSILINVVLVVLAALLLLGFIARFTKIIAKGGKK